ncbi:hypothetical protein K8R43_02875 [archaeon]|nr:hypothetical protein [archaeon]
MKVTVVLLVILVIALVGCIFSPPEPPVGDCITKEDLVPGAQIVAPDDVSGFEDTGFTCMPYEIDYCAGQCEDGICPEPGVYSYQCWVEF